MYILCLSLCILYVYIFTIIHNDNRDNNTSGRFFWTVPSMVKLDHVYIYNFYIFMYYSFICNYNTQEI